MINNKKYNISTKAYKELAKFCADRNYVSLVQINNFLAGKGYNYSKETIKNYIAQLKNSKVIYSAGRGYYSTIENEFKAKQDDLREIIQLIKEKYPLLNFSIWSTKILSPFFHHTQNRFYFFLYSEIDALPLIRDFLFENNYKVFLNPSKNDKNFILTDNMIILRSDITRSKSQSNIAVIEKILVDYLIESERLDLLDFSEYEKVFNSIITSFRLNISYLLDYAERRKIEDKIKTLTVRHTNATFGV